MKPSELYIGVVDLFSIFVPGAIFTAIVLGYWQPEIDGRFLEFLKGDAATRWAALLVTSYFFGHLIYGIGALLDSPIYDLFRRLRWGRDGEHSAYTRVTKLRQEMRGGTDSLAVNNFKWAKSVLLAKAPGGLAEVNRMEADSKFFRSLVVLCALAAMVLFFSGGPVGALAIEKPGWVATGALGLMILSFWRYASLRYKSTQLAYTHIVIHSKLPGAGK